LAKHAFAAPNDVAALKQQQGKDIASLSGIRMAA
jgi:hypothetical protein